jgi:hypothetical protein
VLYSCRLDSTVGRGFLTWLRAGFVGSAWAFPAWGLALLGLFCRLSRYQYIPERGVQAQTAACEGFPSSCSNAEASRARSAELGCGLSRDPPPLHLSAQDVVPERQTVLVTFGAALVVEVGVVWALALSMSAFSGCQHLLLCCGLGPAPASSWKPVWLKDSHA